MDRFEFELMQRRPERKYEAWGFWQLSFAIIGVVLFLIFGLEWMADSATPG